MEVRAAEASAPCSNGGAEGDWHEVRSHGRLCVLGEHSDWAGAFRSANAAVPPGATIVVGTPQGLRARCRPLARHAGLVLRTVVGLGEDGSRPVERAALPADVDALRAVAAEGASYFAYCAGTAAKVLELFDVGGLELDVYECDLPVKKGLSSSAAVCVLVARAFSTAYGLRLSVRGEMEIAYMGERLTPSKCGRMDQACAFGPVPVVLRYDGDSVDVRPLRLGSALEIVVADLEATKDTVRILADLQSAFPGPPTTEAGRKVHELLGATNLRLVDAALEALERGDHAALGAAMREFQAAFDDAGSLACPSELSAPRLHSVMASSALHEHAHAVKGVGSQGDGSVQVLCRSPASAEAVCQILREDFGLRPFRLSVAPTGVESS